MSLLGGQIHGLLSHYLLALPEGDVVEVPVVSREAHLLAESLDVFKGIHSGRQDEEDGCARPRLLKGLGKFQSAIFYVLTTKLLCYKVTVKAKSEYRYQIQAPSFSALK